MLLKIQTINILVSCAKNVSVGLWTLKTEKNSCEKAVESALDSFEKACGIWTHYNESVSNGQCATCSHFDMKCRAGRPKKNKKTQKRKQPSNDSTVDLTFSPTFDSVSTPVKRMKVLNTMQTTPVTPDVTDATMSPFVKETLRQVNFLKTKKPAWQS